MCRILQKKLVRAVTVFFRRASFLIGCGARIDYTYLGENFPAMDVEAVMSCQRDDKLSEPGDLLVQEPVVIRKSKRWSKDRILVIAKMLLPPLELGETLFTHFLSKRPVAAT